MFLKKFKNKLLLLLIIGITIPTQVLAYSDYIIAGGENIGIELNSDGIIIVGTYKIDNEDPAANAKLSNGDKIIAINDHQVNTITEMLDEINNTNLNNIRITYKRNNNTFTTNLSLIKDNNNIYKTGLYVKDAITGVGTLTFIDPKTKIYGALGHEIIEKNTGKKLEIKDGKIYDATITSITPSDNGNPGEKNAKYDNSKIYGNVNENTNSGIFGKYTSTLPNKKLYKVANPDEINLGNAKILTTLNDKIVTEYDINIIKLSIQYQETKNLLFEITDKELLEKTGGIIQGMSGSPIIQNDKIIGAVTHVVVDDCKKGYGIYITNMLEEAEN